MAFWPQEHWGCCDNFYYAHSLRKSGRNGADLPQSIKLQDIVKTIEDLDSVAVSLPDLLRGARGQTVTSNARAIAELSELLKLEVLLDKPRAEVVASALRLLTLIKQTNLLVSSSRVGHEERMAMSLAEALASKLHKLLKDWATESQASTAA